ncbi:MAG: ABC transporter ATP-binding protein [Gemmatimonadota bacterium]
MTPLLSVTDLRIDILHRGARAVLEGVSFDVAAGDTLGVVGASGGGKTSLALALMGLLPPGLRATGRVAFEGRDLLTVDDRARRDLRGRRLSMVFQEPFTALNPRQRVGAQVAEMATAHGERDARRARRDAVAMLGRVGLAEPDVRAQRLPHQLSGGERQRVLLAMALLLEPALLIADEPTSALDVTVQGQVLELLREQQRELGMALLLVSHDLGVVAGTCSRTLVLHEGRIVEDAPTREVFTAPRHPLTTALVGAVSRITGRA